MTTENYNWHEIDENSIFCHDSDWDIVDGDRGNYPYVNIETYEDDKGEVHEVVGYMPNGTYLGIETFTDYNQAVEYAVKLIP